MATGTSKFEDYNIILRSGDAYISRLDLTGWGAYASSVPALRTWSDHGRMWGKITAADVFTLYRRPTLESGDIVVSGAISSGTATLSTDPNISGISGTVDVGSYTSGEEQLFDVLVSYADESDIVTVYPQAANELDSNSKFEGQDTRFEWLLKDVKRTELDPLIWARYKTQLGSSISASGSLLQLTASGVDIQGRPLIGYMSDPRQLSRVHAKLCAARLYERRGASVGMGSMEYIDAGDKLRRQAMEDFNMLELAFDINKDELHDTYGMGGSISIGRG